MPPRRRTTVYRRRRLTALGGVAAVAATGVIAYALVGSGHGSPPPRGARVPHSPGNKRQRPHKSPLRTLAAHPAGNLVRPIQDSAVASLDGSRAMVLGGLTPADTSSDSIRIVGRGRVRGAGRLPGALHDSAAAKLGGSVYLFGGGNGTSQIDQILRITSSGHVNVAGRLPAPSSDQSAAAIGNTAYIVGGYTGSRWLDTIVAWSPGSAARVVARLPKPVRYAAVTVAGGMIVVAGGSLPDGSASRAVLAYSPATRHVIRLGRLPSPTTHAAAASLGGIGYVIGGRGASVGTPTARIFSVDAGSHRIRPAGALPAPTSDLGATTLGARILVVGGRTNAGTQASLLTLGPGKAVVKSKVNGRTSTQNVYAADRLGMLTGAARFALPRVYVPNSASGSVDVIDQRTFHVVGHFAVGDLPQHVTPSYDLRTLYVDNDVGNSLTPIDPATAKPGHWIRVADPYNLYFTPDGLHAIVVAERRHRLDFRHPKTFRLEHSLRVPCAGVNHMDFSADGSYAIVSCEFSGQLLKLDLRRQRVAGVLRLPRQSAIPQDVRAAPDGSIFYVADLAAGGLWRVDGPSFRVLGFIRTGKGAHGLVVSRDGRNLYVSNRNAGTVSVLSFRKVKVVANWSIPGGSPDMGGVSADGKVLWLTGRFNAEVYAIDTRSGRLRARIPVGASPHGLSVWPQPGRYSLGHTGDLR